MENGRELIDALSAVAQEKRIDKEIIFEAIETSLVSACKKHYGQNANINVIMNRRTGIYTVLAQKHVVEEVTDPVVEISLKDAVAINSSYELDDIVEIEVTPGNFGRIAAQTAKQVVLQKFREAERDILYNEYIDKEHDVISGTMQRRDRKNIIFDLGRTDAVMPQTEQVPGEQYVFGERMKLYVTEVKQSNKGPNIFVSRSSPELLKKLFEHEVPEVYDGIVEIKSVAREAGNRSKIAVFTKHPHVDAIGSCVGQNGARVNLISQELGNEKIDIILWNEDPVKYISAALSPSKVVAVSVNPLDNAARVVVPDHQLSLAIGKVGQNARLAAKLTGWRIDIKSESQARGTDFLIFPELENLLPVEEKIKEEELEAAYADFYEIASDEEEATENTENIEETPGDVTTDPETVEEPETIIAEETDIQPSAEYADDEYYDDEYYDDEYDDENGSRAAEASVEAEEK